MSPSRPSVVRAYAELVAATYDDTLRDAKLLQSALQEFADEPSETSLAAAKQAWLVARDPYGQSEAFRFYQGPIDNDDSGPEGRLNAWPIDESYIDYVSAGGSKILTGGIINLPEDYPTIDAEVLQALNEKDGETNISTGYHALEFLLWGQDLNPTGAGERPFGDYVVGANGTAENQARRAQYLLTTAEILVEDLTQVQAAWLSGEPNYRADFEALPSDVALGNILIGMGSLAGAELAGERMTVAYDNKDQEDEHSCFSDNTKADLWNNASSIQHVLLGNYAKLDGPGVDELIEAVDPELAQQLRMQIQEALAEIEAIPGSFDQAILGDDADEGRVRLQAAIRALQAFTETLLASADALQVELKLE